MHFRCLPAAALAFAALVTPAGAWDPLGHMLVGQIACDQLTPTARAAVERSLAAFNRKNHTKYTPVIAACWMDDIRGQTQAYHAWHYVNLPFTPDGRPFPDGASEPDVLWGIKLCIGIIEGKQTHPGIDRDQALVMLFHLVGDVHQPLHATSRIDASGESDRGGNGVEITNMKDPELAIFNKKSGNLHWFWDGAYHWNFKNGTAVAEFSAPLYPRDSPVPGHLKALPLVRRQAARLVNQYPTDPPSAQADPGAWVSESHAIGFDFAYGQLPGGPAANPATLDAGYIDKAREIGGKRIVVAGRRLGALLNSLYR